MRPMRTRLSEWCANRRSKVVLLSGPSCILVIVILLSLSAMVQAKINNTAQPVSRVPDAFIDPGNKKDRYLIVVEKTTQTLFLYEYKNNQYYLLKKFLCTTGENIGDKTEEGDKKTPEGFYIFNKKSVESELAPIYGVLAYPMDYPNFWDRHVGKGGSGIWMHGSNKPRVPRDSNGCIALDNVDMIEIERNINLYDTPILIYDRIRYVSPDKIRKEASRIKSFVESWRQAWQNKDFPAYRSKYARDFISNDGKNYEAWMAHKERLNHKYKQIKVDLKNVRMFRHNDTILVIFTQSYRGDGSFDSQGLKRLYLRPTRGGYEIVAEEWNDFPSVPPARYLAQEVKDRILAEGRLKTTVAVAANNNPKYNEEETEPKTAAKPVIKKPPVQKAKITVAPGPTAPRPGPSQTALNKRIIGGSTSISPVSPDKADRENVRQAIKDWLDAWQKKDINRYLSWYHPEFRYKDMDLVKYRAYKEELTQKYDNISIGVDQMKIKVEGKRAWVTFVQDYRSDQYSDYGLKTLVLYKNGNGWQIRKETWQDMRGGAKP